jgi:biotin carboxylase
LRFADEAICIGPADPAESYLNIPRIISAAEVADVDAIHPGYGFLAENINFAQICKECGITFIGPPVEAMRLLGDKVEARKLAQKARVRVVPGSGGVVDNEAEALKHATKIGYPLMIKATAGGGGRGMRTSVTTASISKNASLNLAMSKFRSSPTTMGTHCTSTSATAPSSEGTRKSLRSHRALSWMKIPERSCAKPP